MSDPRFDSELHLQRWRDLGEFPAIHRGIAELALRATQGPMLDLCCSTGLLGQQMLARGRTCLGVDRSEVALATGQAYGITLPTVTRDIVTMADWCWLGTLIAQRHIRTVLARRCLPELFTDASMRRYGPNVARLLAEAGVKQLVLEGRRVPSRAVHPLGSADQEALLLVACYRLAYSERHLRVLELR